MYMTIVQKAEGRRANERAARQQVSGSGEWAWVGFAGLVVRLPC